MSTEGIHICLHHIAEEDTQGPGILGFNLSRLVELDSIFTEIGQPQRLLQQSTVSVRIGAHAARPVGVSSLSSGTSEPFSSNNSSGL